MRACSIICSRRTNPKLLGPGKASRRLNKRHEINIIQAKRRSRDPEKLGAQEPIKSQCNWGRQGRIMWDEGREIGKGPVQTRPLGHVKDSRPNQSFQQRSDKIFAPLQIFSARHVENGLKVGVDMGGRANGLLLNLWERRYTYTLGSFRAWFQVKINWFKHGLGVSSLGEAGVRDDPRSLGWEIQWVVEIFTKEGSPIRIWGGRGLWILLWLHWLTGACGTSTWSCRSTRYESGAQEWSETVHLVVHIWVRDGNGGHGLRWAHLGRKYSIRTGQRNEHWENLPFQAAVGDSNRIGEIRKQESGSQIPRWPLMTPPPGIHVLV